MIAHSGKPGWRHDGGVAKKRHVANRRGWAGDVNDNVEGAQAHGLVLLFARCGTGRVESCRRAKIRAECKLGSAVVTAALGGDRRDERLMLMN